jgi:DNA mismatch repair protein MutS2
MELWTAEERLDAARFALDALEFGAAKEGLARHLASSLGRRALAELAPLVSDEVERMRALQVELSGMHAAGDVLSLGGVVDPARILSAARKGEMGEEELASLRGFCGAVERLAQWCGRRAAESPGLGELGRGLPSLVGLLERLRSSVDERGRVLSEASPLLARLRKEERDLGRSIDRKLRAVLRESRLGSALADGQVHLRGGRLCVALKAKMSGRLKGVLHDRSASEQTVYIEPEGVVAIANRQAECRIEERREVNRILVELARVVLDEEVGLALAARGLARLEVAHAAVLWSEEVGARSPELAGDGGAGRGLVLRGARHPLLLEEERAERLEEVVPIDLRLGEEFDLLILTGPNTGGKTVALKTLGLVALFVRCGLPFPCKEGSVVPLYEGVAVDIGDEQEIRQSLSTFSSHLVRIREALAQAGERTLVLLDELGGGTDPDEGAALGEALLEELLARRASTMVSTHLGRLKEFAYRNARAENACAEFDVETLEPKYSVCIGTPGESTALAVAARLGLAREIIERAAERLERRDEDTKELFEELRATRLRAEEARSAAEGRLEDATQTSRELAEEREELARKSGALEDEAQRSLDERLRGARDGLLRGRKLLNGVPVAQRAELEGVFDRIEEHLVGATLTERRTEFLEALRKGDSVYFPRYGRRCVVHKIDREGREVVVKLGSMKMRVGVDEITWLESL